VLKKITLCLFFARKIGVVSEKGEQIRLSSKSHSGKPQEKWQIIASFAILEVNAGVIAALCSSSSESQHFSFKGGKLI